MSNAQHLIENAVCCLESNEGKQTFLNQEKKLCNICLNKSFTAEEVLDMIWDMAIYVCNDYRLWLRNEFGKEMDGGKEDATNR